MALPTNDPLKCNPILNPLGRSVPLHASPYYLQKEEARENYCVFLIFATNSFLFVILNLSYFYFWL